MNLIKDFGKWNVVVITAVLTGILVANILYVYGFTEAGMTSILKETGRLSYPLFLMCFLASSLQKIWRNSFSKWLAGNRKYLGISFAVVYAYHSIGMFGFMLITKTPGIEGIMLFLSVLAYIFVIVMTVTSFKAVYDRMPVAAWRIIHTLGMYLCWYFFLAEFIHKTEVASYAAWYYMPLASSAFLAFAIRIIANLMPTRSRSAVRTSA
ncbi:MAG TPA: hypothetical protein V6D10_18680 [Trichocoleus sp.]|jgi:DMSO/TMAO reductase YedYZ heme-binding membrane subunit